MEVFFEETKRFEIIGRDDILKASVKVSKSDDYIVIDLNTVCGHWEWDDNFIQNKDWNFIDKLSVMRNGISKADLMRLAVKTADDWFARVEEYRIDLSSTDKYLIQE